MMENRPMTFIDEVEAWTLAYRDFFEPLIDSLPPTTEENRGGRKLERRSLQGGGGVEILWDNYYPRAIATVFRNDSNYSVLITQDLPPLAPR